MASTPCSYHSITLQDGDSFVLPPGATIISATDPDLIISLNGCADDQIANLETPVQYGIRLAGSLSNDSGTENWEGLPGQDQNFFVDGILVSDIYYAFNSPIPASASDNGLTFKNALDTTPFGNAFSSFGNVLDPNSSNKGWSNRVWFNTIPTIGNNLYFKIRTNPRNQDAAVGPVTATTAYTKAILGGGYDGG